MSTLSTLRFLRDLAAELGCDLIHLDDKIVEYVLEVGNTSNIEQAARMYREYSEDRVNP